MNQYDFSAGTLYSYNRRVAEEEFTRYLNIGMSRYFRGCFATYFSNYKDDEESLYYAFTCLPTYFPDVLKDLNGFYENIKYEVIKEKHITLRKRKFPNGNNIYYMDGYGEEEVPMKQFLLRNTFDPNYNIKAKKYLTYNLSILVRMLNPAEGYISPHADKLPTEDYIDFLIRINNKNKGYRSFSEKDISRDILKSFDDIENCNLVYYKQRSYARQTGIIYMAAKKYVPKYKIQYKNLGYLKYDYNNFVRRVYGSPSSDQERQTLFWLLSPRGKTFELESATNVSGWLNSVFGTKDFQPILAD